jgi:CBS domain-containing protein
MPIPIHHLTQDQAPLVFVAPGDNLEDAVGKMIEHDFSQLPVVENGRPYGKPASFVTSSSVARALRIFRSPLHCLRVRDAVIPAPTVLSDDDVFAKMDDLLDAYAVLVLNPDGTIAGIVTNYDTTQYFRRRAEDVLLVEDIETTLKDHIRSAYGGDEGDPDGPLSAAVNSLSTPTDSIREACRKSFRRFCGIKSIAVTEADASEFVERSFGRPSAERTFEDLTLFDYIELACRSEAWERLGVVFGVPKTAFREMLDDVRKTRNKLMHFRADVDAVERDRLRFCAEWFKNHPPMMMEDAAADEPGGKTSADIPAPPEIEDGLQYVEDASAGTEAGYTGSDIVDSKYAPLARHLARLPRSLDRVALTFGEIEEIIRAELPAAARDHRAWWSNDTTAHVQSAQWLEVNWRVVSINMTNERVVFARARDRERAYIHFFSMVQNRLRETDLPLASANPLGQNWIPIIYYHGTGLTLVLSFARRRRFRLECYIDTGDGASNTELFRRLYAHQDSLEAVVGSTLEWERLDNRRACRVALYTSGSINEDPADLEKLVEWVVENTPRMHRGLADLIPLVSLEGGPITNTE